MEGYVLSERDYQRIERAIRFVERKADVTFRRKFPVHLWGMGGGGFPLPTERVGIYTTTVQLTKADHEKKIIFINNNDGSPLGPDGDCNLTAAESPAVGDTYFLHCLKSGTYACYLHPNVGQTIIMPSRKVIYGDGYYVWMGDTDGSYTMYQLILVCCAANTWISWAATTSQVINT